MYLPKRALFHNLLSDLRNASSHSLDYLLSDRVEDCLSAAGMAVRRPLAPLLRMAYRTQTPYKIIAVHREPLPHSKMGRIFVLNHRQGDDIVTGANVVGQSAYIVFGNRYLSLDTLNGFGLWAYGMILVDRDRKESRKAAYEKMKFVICHGGNVMIYPEGYWNLDDNGEQDERHGADSHNSESWLIQDFNIGAFRLAKETGCEIVPTVLHYDEHGKKICYGARGKPFVVGSQDDVFEKKEQLLTIMRTMYYELMETYSAYKRQELEASGQTLREQWSVLKNDLLRVWDIERTGYQLDLTDEKRIGKAKVAHPVITSGDAFAHLDKLIPCKENAFLFRYRYKENLRE